MRRIAPTIPVPPKVFRHFAVITILITACIALFADGERRDAIGAELDSQKQKTVMAQAEPGSLGPNKTSSKKVYYPARGGGEGDSGSGAGVPMVNPEGVSQSVSDAGTMRLARDFDYGRTNFNPAEPSGPPGLAELSQGKTSTIRIGAPRKVNANGANVTTRGPTDAQRNAIDAEGFRRAGPPTPPKQ